MSDITELERRITAALERIGQGTEALAAAAQAGAAEDQTETAADAEALATALAALEAEREASAKLEARVKAIGEKQDKQVAQLEARVTKLTARAEATEGEIERLRRVNAQLRANNKALREANAKGLGDGELINTSMKAELDALRAVRDTDRSELDEILGMLAPLVAEDTNA
jgi:membrane protein involved in colicin uptake